MSILRRVQPPTASRVWRSTELTGVKRSTSTCSDGAHRAGTENRALHEQWQRGAGGAQPVQLVEGLGTDMTSMKPIQESTTTRPMRAPSCSPSAV